MIDRNSQNFYRFKFKFNFKDALVLSTRPNLSSNAVDYSSILRKTPATSLNKLINFVGNLTHIKDDKYKQFGKEIKSEILNITKNYQKENQLTNRSDKDVYHAISQICRHFDEEELVSADLAMV